MIIISIKSIKMTRHLGANQARLLPDILAKQTKARILHVGYQLDLASSGLEELLLQYATEEELYHIRSGKSPYFAMKFYSNVPQSELQGWYDRAHSATDHIGYLTHLHVKIYDQKKGRAIVIVGKINVSGHLEYVNLISTLPNFSPIGLKAAVCRGDFGPPIEIERLQVGLEPYIVYG